MGFRRTDKDGRPLRYRTWLRRRDQGLQDGDETTPALELRGLLSDRAEARKEAQRREREALIASGKRGVDRVPERLRVEVPEGVDVTPPAPEWQTAVMDDADRRHAARAESLAGRPVRRAQARVEQEREREALRVRAAAIREGRGR